MSLYARKYINMNCVRMPGANVNKYLGLPGSHLIQICAVCNSKNMDHFESKDSPMSSKTLPVLL